MSKKILILLFFLFTVFLKGQTLKFTGNINDTSANNGLPNVLMMVLKFSDSTLIKHTRTNNTGFFKPIQVPLDTYLVILSHPSHSDKTFLLVPSSKDSVYNFKNVVLPPKSFVLNEIEIVAPKEKSYYKGDTLIFTADSFKTGANATVEDLLKRLPGMQVDANGKITVQGKEVDQVLVDGDEFFGTDPTIATRNLNASSIDNVQVFDKKNESTEEGANETLKVINLKLKDDAKKGYFGKVSGASDFQKFYEGEFLANHFKGSRKVSLFGLVANTPKQAFGGGDAYKYGLSGEQNWIYDDETGNWINNNERGTGVPLTIKSGFYFNDKIGENTKINADYTFNQNQLFSGSETNTQFFLADTSYSNLKIKTSESKNQNHSFNFRVIQKLDSLTELTLAPKIKYTTSDNSTIQTDDFISGEIATTRRTVIKNTNSNQTSDANIYLKLSRNFMKKDRNISISYQPIFNSSNNDTKLNTDFIYYEGQANDSSLVQKRTQKNSKIEHNASLIYTEPFTKKIKGEFSYNFTNNQNSNNRETFNYRATGYDLLDSNLSNNFENKRVIHRAGTKLTYEVKKYRITVGSYFRNIEQQNVNITTGNKLQLKVNNILPLASFNYRINQGSNLSFRYNSSSQQPDLQQMQPVRDNTDPNRISIGNPDLKPTFSNNLSLNYYFYKGIKDVNFWVGGNYGNTNNQISYATTYDSEGRAITQPVNVNGNYNGNVWLGGGFPLFKKFIKTYYNFNGSFSNNVSLVNSTKNISQNTSLGPSMSVEKNAEKFNIRIGGDYSYNIPKSTISIQSNQPYYSYGLEGSVVLKIRKKFIISTDGRYNDNGNRTPGYNIHYFIWNASIARLFLKTGNLALSLNANDILNQNISNQRYISSNQIVDTKTQIIKRYFLLKLLYKFNNQKTKVEGDDDF
ncbi:outer membrane beta-barrel protein [Aurantibacillus circumpalustris]|uniref:outer membrane beta-barrel protein n=1 Tax=Aurantibacillus circumpalustris TaxID=3036359 RepID=UPI00295B87F3|nr:outer membrane beta-barrel protein [Aurantibacillus circumpalustris]